MSASKQKGTWFETALVQWFDRKGIVAKRIVLHGNKDEGDVDTERFSIEAKNCKAITLASWIKEAEAETINAGKPVVVVAKRAGISDPGRSYVITTLDTFTEMMYGG